MRNNTDDIHDVSDDDGPTGQQSHQDGNSGIDNRIDGEGVPAPPDERLTVNPPTWPKPDKRQAGIL